MVLPKYQTFSRRYLASIIDSVMFLPFSIIAYRMNVSEDAAVYLGWTSFHLLCWTLYVVIGHGIYGQTVGKRLLGIKVLDVSEKRLIGIKKAFLRESVFFFVSVALLITNFNAESYPDQGSYQFGSMVYLISGLWTILELITMFMNKKRRALHDLLAASVVVNLNALKWEELQNRKHEFMTTIQSK